MSTDKYQVARDAIESGTIRSLIESKMRDEKCLFEWLVNEVEPCLEEHGTYPPDDSGVPPLVVSHVGDAYVNFILFQKVLFPSLGK